jgi:hypothetical protein
MMQLKVPGAVALVMLGAALSFNARAAPTLNGQSVTVTLTEPPFPDAVETITAGPGGPQIIGNSSDPVGSILFSAESINVHDLQIVYNIEGGGGVYTGSAPQCAAGCSLWSPTADQAGLIFSDLSFGAGLILSGVSLSTSNVFGVQIEDITANSFEVVFGSAGVLNGKNGIPALGTITMDLQTEAAPVPLPPSFSMLLGGLALLVLARGTLRRQAGAVEF